MNNARHRARKSQILKSKLEKGRIRRKREETVALQMLDEAIDKVSTMKKEGASPRSLKRVVSTALLSKVLNENDTRFSKKIQIAWKLTE